MTDPRFDRLMRLVEEAMACTPEEGDALLAERCGDDLALLEEARELVALSRTGAGAAFTEQLRQGVDVAAAQASGTPEWIGPFRILERLGEGGMGAVYLARQEAPIRREVALKVVRSGYADSQIVARFEAERQALASLDHPGIARVYDAGATDAGLPFFAMEVVRGEPITRYCDRHRLGIDARLALFSQVCRAIQHAHFNGIIHRDIKPSNVLVTDVDGQPVAKVIDFGIAKFASGLASGADGLTGHGAMMGTLEYMSPEQAVGAAVVDTRTDVYSLGVLLYELISGALPFESDTLRGLSPEDVRELLANTDPTPPSARLTDPDRAAELASARGCDPRTLRRRLEGDLDWVVMKALERDPASRYASPLELAAEVDRYLGHVPVLASAPTVFGRAAKFYRRHRLMVTSVTLVFVAVTTGAVLSTIGFQRAAAERVVAEHEALVATRTTRFLTEALAQARPAELEGGETTVRDILDLAAARLESEADMMPEVEARLRFAIGSAYASLGAYDRALLQLARAKSLLPMLGGASSEQAAQALATLSDVLAERGQHVVAMAVNQQLLDLVAKTRGEQSAEYALAQLRSARGFDAMGMRARALALFRQAEALHAALTFPAGEDPLVEPLAELAERLAPAR